MTLLDRFRAQSPDRHPDPAVRLAYVADIPLDDRTTIEAVAREDEDPRVRRAAVGKLLDSSALGSIARDDPDEAVRAAAAAMLRDLALDAFEGATEASSLEAVDALADARTLAQVVKECGREIVALRALSRVSDAHLLGSIARHAALEAARRGGFERLRERGDREEILAVAMNGEYKDTAVAAVELAADRATLEQIATRSRNKAAAKRARGILREGDEGAAREAAEASAAGVADREEGPQAASDVFPSLEPETMGVEPAFAPEGDDGVAAERAEDAARERVEVDRERAAREAEDRARQQAAADDRARRESEQRQARLAEVADAAEAAAADRDLASARRLLAAARQEWNDLVAAGAADAAVAERFRQADSRVEARDAEAQAADARARREALGRLQHLIGRVEGLPGKADVTLKAVDRALRDVKAALSSLPPLPARQDHDEVTRRLKDAQAALTPKMQELREADEWQRWANVGVQEQLCVKMEALRALEDPDAIAREVRELQQQWRQAADVPRAQADALWRRFKSAHDEVWARCEAHFAAQAREREENLAKKIALCEQAESLADSTHWIQTAEQIKGLQAAWKAVGPVPRGREKAIWDRFRAACDRFFTRRHEDLARRKTLWAENLSRKDALCARVEALAESTDWEPAAAEIRRLQAEWKTIGPVKKSRSEAVWQRFRGACDRFFVRFAQRHDAARAERVAAREAICAELESLVGTAEAEADAPPDLAVRVRTLRSRWQQEIAARGVDPDRAPALDRRFAAAFAAVVARWPAAFAGSDLDPDANRKRMEAIVRRVEELAASLGAPAAGGIDAALSPATRLAAMLKEALAANTIGGKVDDDSRLRAAIEEVRQAQTQWLRVGPVPDETKRSLAERFQRACRRVTDASAARGRR